MIVAITGHRPPKLGGYGIPNPIYDAVLEGIDHELLELRPKLLITGMALGVDQWAADLCIWNDIDYLAAVPHDGQESIWPAASKYWYYFLLNKAKNVQVVSPGPYEKWKPLARNKWMVDRADLVLAVWNGTPGGTASCVNYAAEIGKPIKIIQPPNCHFTPVRPASKSEPEPTPLVVPSGRFVDIGD